MKDYSSNDHEIRTGFQLISLDSRSAILPINYFIFSPLIEMILHANIDSSNCNHNLLEGFY